MKPSTNQKGVREFLGMVGYYRKFINRFPDMNMAVSHSVCSNVG